MLDTPSKLAFARPKDDGTFEDGPYMVATDTSGDVNLKLAFLDETGAARTDGYLKIEGAICEQPRVIELGASAGSYSLTQGIIYYITSSSYGGTLTLPLAASNLGKTPIVIYNRSGATYTGLALSGSDTVEGSSGSPGTDILDGDTLVFRALKAGDWRIGAFDTNLGISRLTATTNLVENSPYNIFANTDSVAVTVNLPAAPSSGAMFRIVNTGTSGNNVTVAADAGDDLLGTTGGTFTLLDGETLIIAFQATDGWY